MATYRAEQSIGIAGWECGTEMELSMVVTYSMTGYYPASNEGPEELPQPEDIIVRFFNGNVEIDLPQFIEDAFTSNTSFHDWLTMEAVSENEYQRDCAAEARADFYRHERV